MTWITGERRDGGSQRGLEKLEDMIVRQAEATGAQVAAAKAAIGNVIFGQEKVVEQALITVLSAATRC